LVANYGDLAPEVVGPVAVVELAKAVCGQDLDPFSASSVSLSLFTGCCERSLLPGMAEADGTRATFTVPTAINTETGVCADFFMTTYALSPFPRASVKYVFLSFHLLEGGKADIPPHLVRSSTSKGVGSQVYGLVALDNNGTLPVSNLSQEIVITMPVLDVDKFAGDSSGYECTQ
jgi:hypothetical protein